MTDDFIGVYENVVPSQLCDDLIKFFESCDDLGFTVNRQQHDKANKLEKQDDSLFITKVLNLEGYGIIKPFADIFWSKVYAQYADKYHALSTLSHHNVFEYKLQRTHIGGGYHIWHSEQQGKLTSGRILTFVCYLNDVDVGGETEFFYYPKRIAAKRGAVILFPGGFMHTHRGNPPISNTKYVVTGWVEFAE